jgi:hypothetical protein
MRSRSLAGTSSSKDQKQPHNSTTTKPYILSVEPERSHTGPRFFWTVCAAQKPDELLSWGDSPTRELAVAAANNEIERMKSGPRASGRVRNPKIRDRQDLRVR